MPIRVSICLSTKHIIDQIRFETWLAFKDLRNKILQLITYPGSNIQKFTN